MGYGTLAGPASRDLPEKQLNESEWSALALEHRLTAFEYFFRLKS
jgi:hypothetical protein